MVGRKRHVLKKLGQASTCCVVVQTGLGRLDFAISWIGSGRLGYNAKPEIHDVTNPGGGNFGPFGGFDKCEERFRRGDSPPRNGDTRLSYVVSQFEG